MWSLDEHSTRNCRHCHIGKRHGFWASIKCAKGYELNGSYESIIKKPTLKDVCKDCAEFEDFTEED